MPIALYDGLIDATRAECLVALTVVRATLGWTSGLPGRRRVHACLSHQELKRRTGIRSSTTISRAIDGLVRSGMLETLNRDGVILPTPEARRRDHRALTFRVPRHIAETNKPVDNRVEKSKRSVVFGRSDCAISSQRAGKEDNKT
ncbi:hypothetical protein CCAX7_35590 [Capsulimonas corticalis]|uniref:Uncharacterized protein n=1 Tax=Capsulimonas corticalis TaxID=2219043 RepID=A0A402D633_9BACT|nr:hypothetical protein CCAX7_35590 [Capsulimonas corticalis]